MRLSLEEQLRIAKLWPQLGLTEGTAAFGAGILLAGLKGAAWPALLAWSIFFAALAGGGVLFRQLLFRGKEAGSFPKQLTVLLLLGLWLTAGFARQAAAAWPGEGAAALAGTTVEGQGRLIEISVGEPIGSGGPRLKLVLRLKRQASALVTKDPNRQKTVERLWRRQRRLVLRIPLPAGADGTDYCREKGLTPGAYLGFEAELKEIPSPRNPGEYDQQKGLAAQGIFCQGQAGAEAVCLLRPAPFALRFLNALKESVLTKLSLVLPQKEGALAAACLLGETKGMEEEDLRIYREAGIAHLFAVSGTHGGILLTMSHWLCRGISSKNRLFASAVPLGFLFFYLALTGFPLSMQRTFFMAAASQGAVFLNRPKDSLAVLAGAALLLLGRRPENLFDCGFQLSFGVTLGLLRLQPWLSKKLPGGLAVSLSAQLAAFPLQAYWFHLVQPAGFLLNFMLMLLMPAFLGFSFTAALAGFIFQPLSVGLWYAVGFFAVGMDAFVRVFQPLPFASWAVAERAWPFYLLWGLGLWFLPEYAGLWRRVKEHWRKLVLRRSREPAWQAWQKFYRRKKDSRLGGREDFTAFQYCLSFRERIWQGLRRFDRWVLAGILSLLFVLFALRPQPLELCFLDVGQGDGCFLRTPAGTTWLIDAGSSSTANLAEYRLLPYLRSQGINRLDYVVVSHLDEDHISGVRELLGRIPIRHFILSPVSYREEAGRRLAEEAAAAGAKLILLSAGSRIREGETELICLNPMEQTEKEGNAASLTLWLNYREFSALFTGDIGAEEEKLLWTQGGETGLPKQLTVLKAAHHGSGSSNSTAFLNLLRPKITVISCGEHNFYGHPHPRVLSDLKELGSQVLKTWQTGAITLRTDGKTLRLNRFVPGPFS